MLHLAYFFDGELPSRRAEAIQFLQTAAALLRADGAARVTVWSGPLRAPRAGWLRHYGLEDEPRLRVREFYPAAGGRRPGAGAVAQALADGGGRVVAMSRGEAGIELARWLPAGLPWVMEVHRPSLATMRRPSAGGWRRPVAEARRRRAARREGAALRRADGVAWLTEAVRQELRERYSLNSAAEAVLHSGVAVSADGPGPRPMADDSEAVDVIYVGKLDERKGVSTLVRAVAKLEGCRAAVVGGDAEQVAAYAELARGLGVEAGAIEWAGQVEPSAIGGWYRRARVGVCPLPAGRCAIAERYTSPMKVLEMMSAGVPIVASDLPSIRELLRDGETALLVPPDDPTALAEAVRRLGRDPGLAEALARRAGEAVKAYDWSRRAVRLRELLDAVAERC